MHATELSPSRQFVRSAPPIPTKPAKSATRVLADDRKTVRWLLAETCQKRAADERGRSPVAQRLCAELAVHMQIAEELLYPRLRAVTDDRHLLEQLEVRHKGLRALMQRLIQLDARDPRFDLHVRSLDRYFTAIVQRELLQLLPLLRKLDGDWHTLGAMMMLRHDQLLAEVTDNPRRSSDPHAS